MQNENNNEIKDLISTLISSPAPAEEAKEAEREYTPEELAEINRIKEEAVAEYEAKKAEEEAELKARKEEAKKAMKKTFSACGWSLLLLMGVWLGIVLGFSVVAGVLEGLSISGLWGFSLTPLELYTKYYLIINEAALLVAVFIASLILKTKDSAKPEKSPVSFKKFLMLIPISFAVRTAGTLVSNAISMVTGSYDASTELTELLLDMDIWVVFICVGIAAPIIEELFFRKMLIDRLRPLGEMACLVVSALFFALFHQNISQFFYAFGMGLVLAHLYYHTGRYSLAVVIHMIFNIVGVVPIFFYDSLLDMLGILYAIMDGSSSWEQLIPFIPTIAAYLVYALVIFALSIAGIIIIGMNYKKFKIQKSDSPLSPAEQRKVFWKTSGVIAAVVVTGALTLLSL